MAHEGISLKNYLREKGINQEEFASKLDLTRQGLRYHFNKEKLDYEFKEKLSEHGVNIFFTNVKQSNGLKSNAIELKDVQVMMVPFIHKFARAGYLTGYGDDEFLDELPKIPMVIENPHKGKYIAIELKGDSMFDESYNSYLEGDIVFGREVQKQHWYNKLHINKWDFIIVHKEEGILVKRIIAHNVANATITIHSLNDEFEDQILNLDDILEIYNVVKIEREMKR